MYIMAKTPFETPMFLLSTLLDRLLANFQKLSMWYRKLMEAPIPIV